ncbi:uncharacterized protein LOC125178317 [Hyalella azteca]|uniref:Uncharacterized protein LOC125178317 n=1 Tax=Hyalella azteca TaxID=294128 RepID=A0A979FL52_HYAAZ|nr:uncharacterized protein LOC125178317 [Hyalella azteca]
MAASVRLPSFDEQDFIGPEGRELLASLAEVEAEVKVQKLPSLLPRVVPRGTQPQGKDTFKKLKQRPGPGALQGSVRTKEKRSTKTAKESPNLETKSNDGMFQMSAAEGKNVSFTPGAGMQADETDTGKFPFPANEMELDSGCYDGVLSITELGQFHPYFTPLDEDLDTKLRKWSKRQRSQDIKNFALPPITPHQLVRERKSGQRRAQSAGSALDAIPDRPKQRAKTSVPLQQTARQYVWETLATAKERHLNAVIEAKHLRSKAALEAEEAELCKLEEQIQLHEEAFDDFLSSNYKKVASTLQKTAEIKAQKKEQDARLEYFSGLLQESQTELQEETERLQEVSAYHAFLLSVTPSQTYADLQRALNRRAARKKALAECSRSRLVHDEPQHVTFLNHLEEEVRTLRLLDFSDADIYENYSKHSTETINDHKIAAPPQSTKNKTEPVNRDSRRKEQEANKNVVPDTSLKISEIKTSLNDGEFGRKAVAGVASSAPTQTSRHDTSIVLDPALPLTASSMQHRQAAATVASSEEKEGVGAAASVRKKPAGLSDVNIEDNNKEKGIPIMHPESTIEKEVEFSAFNLAEDDPPYLDEHAYDEFLKDPSYLIRLAELYESQCHSLLTLLGRLEDHIEVTERELDALAQRSRNRAEEFERRSKLSADAGAVEKLRLVQQLKNSWPDLSEHERLQQQLNKVLSQVMAVVSEVLAGPDGASSLLQTQQFLSASDTDSGAAGGMAVLGLLEARFTALCIQLDAIEPRLRDKIFLDCENERKLLTKEARRAQENLKRAERKRQHLERALAPPRR